MTADNVGMDFGKEPPAGLVMIGREVIGRVTDIELIFGGADWFRVGDSIAVDGFSNRFRHVVSAVFKHKVECKRLYRPSRGYARHIRRQKAKGLRK